MGTPVTLRCAARLLQKDLSNQVAIVTGANKGCGLETTRQLIEQGATVVLACRDKGRGEAAATEVGPKGTFLQLDLSSLASVRHFAEEFKAKFDRLDILVMNAGLVCPPKSTTVDGYDIQLQANYLGHFLLMELLALTMVKTAEDTGKKSRAVALSSCGAAETGFNFPPGMPQMDFDDLNSEKEPYNTFAVYQRSKLANFLHMLEAPRRHPEGIIFASVHPGWVVKADPTGTFQMLPKDGSQSTLHAVLEDEDKMINGGFYSQTGVYKDEKSTFGGFPMKLPNPCATPEAAAKLWEEGIKLAKL